MIENVQQPYKAISSMTVSYSLLGLFVGNSDKSLNAFAFCASLLGLTLILPRISAWRLLKLEGSRSTILAIIFGWIGSVLLAYIFAAASKLTAHSALAAALAFSWIIGWVWSTDEIENETGNKIFEEWNQNLVIAIWSICILMLLFYFAGTIAWPLSGTIAVLCTITTIAWGVVILEIEDSIAFLLASAPVFFYLYKLGNFSAYAVGLGIIFTLLVARKKMKVGGSYPNKATYFIYLLVSTMSLLAGSVVGYVLLTSKITL